ncbi:MAG: response regulator, partial [Oligoflexales bacterium]|nr:response regulator [Oligoflexales bacterium]
MSEKWILVIDDSEIARREMKEILEGAGYQAVFADSGAMGIEQLKIEKDIKLIICDYYMPG